VYAGPVLHTINPDGTQLRVLPDGFMDGFGDLMPSWSPMGDKIVFIVNVWDFVNDIFIANADGTQRRFFHGCDWRDNSCGRDALDPKFSPDGTKIVFSMTDRFRRTFQMFVKNIDGTGLKLLADSAQMPSWQPRTKSNADFDGDGRADVSVFRPTDSTWYLNRSTLGFAATQFGSSTDKLVPADYDGDGKTDIATFRDGVWSWINSSNQTVSSLQFGLLGDIPVPADYSGDGRDELAVYRNGQWLTFDLSNNQTTLMNFGFANDTPVPADYDGDGKIDQAVYRNGEWHINGSSEGDMVAQFGLPRDRPVAADYDGDGKADLAVYRDGIWYMQQTSQSFVAFLWGIATDIPTPADYDGDGKTDAAVFRHGIWYLRQTTKGVSIQLFGDANDRPLTSVPQP